MALQARLDHVRVNSQQLHHHHPHVVHVADGRPSPVSLHRHLPPSQPRLATAQPVPHSSVSRFSRRHVHRALCAQLRPVQTSVAQ